MYKFFFVSIFFVLSINAQNAAVSSHTNFGTNIEGDITINEVRIPKTGVAYSTYYETLGFWGNTGNSTGNGYGGIQKSTDPRGDRIHIFSIWHALNDPSDTTNFPYAAFLGHGTVSEFFGGEGVGLKTWNFVLGWNPDVWYTHVVRVWDYKGESYYGYFVRDGDSGVWRHLSTIAVKEKGLRITGSNDAFIEDWAGSGENYRETNLRNCWRRDLSGEWNASQSGKYSVNYWDFSDASKRSWNYRTNWDGGIKSDSTGSYYFMACGGTSSPTPPLSYPDNYSATFSLSNSNLKPDYPKISLNDLEVVPKSSSEVEVSWSIDSTGLPQFRYSVELFNSLDTSISPVSTVSDTNPDISSILMNATGFNLPDKEYALRLSLWDIFDNKITEASFKYIAPNSVQLSTKIKKKVLSINNNVLSISLPENITANLILYDISGRAIKSVEGVANKTQVDLKSMNISSKICFAKLTFAGESTFSKIILK